MTKRERIQHEHTLQTLENLRKEKSGLEDLLVGIKQVLFGRNSYDYDNNDIAPEISKLKHELGTIQGTRNVRAEALEEENQRLFALTRFMAGDKDVFKQPPTDPRTGRPFDPMMR